MAKPKGSRIRRKSMFSLEQQRKLKSGWLPSQIPGTRYEEAFKKTLDEIAKYYKRPKEIEDYIALGPYDNGLPRVEITESELGLFGDKNGAIRIRVGSVSGSTNLPPFELTGTQLDALKELGINRYYYSAKKRGLL